MDDPGSAEALTPNRRCPSMPGAGCDVTVPCGPIGRRSSTSIESPTVAGDPEVLYWSRACRWTRPCIGGLVWYFVGGVAVLGAGLVLTFVALKARASIFTLVRAFAAVALGALFTQRGAEIWAGERAIATCEEIVQELERSGWVDGELSLDRDLIAGVAADHGMDVEFVTEAYGETIGIESATLSDGSEAFIVVSILTAPDSFGRDGTPALPSCEGVKPF